MQLRERYVLFIVTATVAMILLACASQVQAAAITIGPGELIQSAIESASPGDEIKVQSGTYQESINITKPLRLIGIDTGSGNPVVDSGDSGSAITISARGTLLSGFIARSQSGWNGDAGIKSIADDCTITGNSASSNSNIGIFICRASNNTVTGNVARQNRNEGIYLEGSIHSLVEGNTVSNNRYGIRLTSSESCTVERNVAEVNRFSGIYLDHSQDVLVQDNFASGNDAGVSADNSKRNTIAGNNITGNQRGIYLSFQNTSNSTKAKGKGVYIQYKAPSHESSSGSGSGSRELSRNVVYQNNLSNSENAYDDGINQWDNGTAGNSFSDFCRKDQGCENVDGICSTSYRIPGGTSVDRYPIAAPIIPVLTGIRSKGPGGAELILDRSGALPGGRVDVKYTAPGEAWIRLAKGCATLTDEQVHGNASGSLSIQVPDQVGSYRVVMHASNGTEIISLPLEVAVPGISASPDQVVICGTIFVAYKGAPGFKTDWIGMYAVGSPDDRSIYRSYLDGRWNGTIQFSAPTAGSYEFRMFENDSYNRLCSTGPVVVKDTSGVKVTAEPVNAHTGETITVSYWGAPRTGAGVINMYPITRPDKFYLDLRSLSTNGCGQVTFVPPGPGTYDFRMFEDNVWRNILGQSNAVTVT